MMAEAKAEHKSSEEGVWNSAQLAYKIVQNSTYGALGSAKGLIPAKQIAATVTTIGRGMIADTKAFLEKVRVRLK